MDNEIGRLVRQVQRLGWRVSSGRHFKCVSRDGRRTVIVDKAPASRHAIRAIRADFRRAGLEVDRGRSL